MRIFNKAQWLSAITLAALMAYAQKVHGFDPLWNIPIGLVCGFLIKMTDE